MTNKLIFLYEFPLPSVNYNDFIVISLNDNISLELKKRKINFKTSEDYRIKPYFMPKEAFELHRAIGDILVDGKTVRESLTYDGFCLWDNIQYNFCSYLYEHRHARLKIVDLVKAIVSVEKPQEIYLQSKNSLYGRAIADVASTLGLRFRVKSNFSKDIELFIKDSIQNRVAFLLKNYKRRLRRTNKVTKDHFDILVPLLIPSFVTMAKPVINGLEKNKLKVLCVSVEESPHEKMIETLKKEKINYNIIESYIDSGVYKNVKNKFKYFNTQWKRISSNKEFCSKLVYHDINIPNTIGSIFDFYFVKRKRVFDVLVYYEAFKRVLDLEKPKLILTLGESADTIRPMLEYAKESHIKSIFLQHGVVKDTPVYGEVLVDALAVWGAESKSEYVKREIDSKKIFIVGITKLDYIKNFKVDRAKIFNLLGLDESKPIFLYLTQPHEKTTNQRLTKIIFEGIKDYDANIVLKLHPRESSASFYEDIAKEFGLKIACTHHNLNEMISVCDYVFGSTSSAGLEVLALEKPLIIVSLPEQKSRNIYLEKKAALIACNADEIKKAIDSLKDKLIIKELDKSRKEFLKETLYKIDGKSSLRVVKMIQNLLKNKF